MANFAKQKASAENGSFYLLFDKPAFYIPKQSK